MGDNCNIPMDKFEKASIYNDRPDRDQFHSKTRDRIRELKDKKCDQCGEHRIKALLRQNDFHGSVSCYNCKKHNKVYAYEISGNMHKNTKMHYDEIRALQSFCYNKGCTEVRPKALMVILHKGKKLLLCRNREKFNKPTFYESYDIVLPW